MLWWGISLSVFSRRLHGNRKRRNERKGLDRRRLR
jgi:hypothetical protein